MAETASNYYSQKVRNTGTLKDTGTYIMHSPTNSAFIAARQQPPSLVFRSTHQNDLNSTQFSAHEVPKQPVLTIENENAYNASVAATDPIGEFNNS